MIRVTTLIIILFWTMIRVTTLISFFGGVYDT